MSIIEDAKAKLRILELNEVKADKRVLGMQSDLFVLSKPDELRQRIINLDVDSLSPREALAAPRPSQRAQPCCSSASSRR